MEPSDRGLEILDLLVAALPATLGVGQILPLDKIIDLLIGNLVDINDPLHFQPVWINAVDQMLFFAIFIIDVQISKSGLVVQSNLPLLVEGLDFAT